MYVLNKISLDYKDDKSRNKLKGVAKSFRNVSIIKVLNLLKKKV